MKGRNDALAQQIAALLDAGPESAAAKWDSTPSALADFRHFLIGHEGLGAGTADSYVTILNALNRKHGLDLLRLSGVRLIQWSADARASTAPATIRLYMSTLRKWADFSGQGEAVKGLKGPRLDPEPKPLPPTGDVAAVRDAFRVDKHDRSLEATIHRRDGQIFDMLFGAILRISDAIKSDEADLKVKDAAGSYRPWSAAVDAAAWPTHLHVRKSKRSKSRMVPLTPELGRSLANWVRLHRPILLQQVPPGGDVAALFHNRNGERCSYKNFHDNLAAAGKRAGVRSIGGKTHTGRKAGITELVAAGMPLHSLIRMSGHENVGQLKPYVKLSDNQVDDDFQRAIGRK